MSDNVSRLEYMKLMNPYLDIDELKRDLISAIWNDERFLRQDIEDVAHELLRELKMG
jgi:hypothetical protein